MTAKKYQLINSLEKLEDLLETTYDIPNREEFGQYIFAHPLRFTPYLLKQIKRHQSVAKQYLPDPRELEPEGESKPAFTGGAKTGIPGLERLYLDRVILMPSSQCFAYCRFCFRKNYSHDTRDGDYGTPQDNFKKALDYIAADKRIKEVLITGGDPLMFRDKVLELCQQLQEIPHLEAIRIGTRIFTSDPELIDEEWIKPFSKLNQDRFIISISPHINHTDELSPETEKSLLNCTQSQVPLYNQTVLLKGINDDADALIELNRKLRLLGVEPYRIYQADPLQGTNYLRTSLKETKRIKSLMRAKASGRVVPPFILDTQLGKVDITDATVVRQEKTILWIKTPYSVQIFRSIDPNWEVPTYCEEAEDGSLIVEWEDAS